MAGPHAMTGCAATVAAMLAALVPAAAVAQAYPAKPIRFVAPFAPGGGVDIITRTLASKLTETIGQTVLVENRTGANGNIGAEAVAKAPPDGYLLLLASPSAATSVHLVSRLGYDPVKDFAPVIQVGYGPLVLSMHPSVPARTVKELVALARAKPGGLNYASGGIGTSQHLAGELFKSIGKVDIQHVGYKGAAPALIDIIGGQVAFMFNNTLEIAAYVKAGRLRPLAITGPARVPLLPDTPTFSESGWPDFNAVVWWGVLAPAGTPRDVVGRLHAEFTKVLGASDVRERLTGLGAVIQHGSSEEWGTFFRGEVDRWGKVIRAAGIRGE